MSKPLPIVSFAATALLAWPALASADPADVERCRSIDDLEARIACLEAALVDSEIVTPDTPQSAEPTIEAPTSPPAAGEVPPVPSPATVSPSVADDLPPEEPAVRDQVTVPLPVETDSGDDVAAAADAGMDADTDSDTDSETDTDTDTNSDIGAEQLRRQSGDDNLARAAGLVVDRYDQVPFRRLVVYLENGQVWRQIKGDTQTIRATKARNQTVDIEESALGGYRLRLNEMRRTIRVERVR